MKNLLRKLRSKSIDLNASNSSFKKHEAIGMDKVSTVIEKSVDELIEQLERDINSCSNI